MATLAESFLEDLEDLEDLIPEVPEVEEDLFSDDEIADAVRLYDLGQGETVTVVSNLTRQEPFLETLARVRELTPVPPGSRGAAEGVFTDEEFELIEECNKLVAKVDTEILHIHKFIRDIYAKKFPELESIVFSPLEYIAIVKRIQNQTDLTQVDLSDLMPNTVIMAVTVAASTSTGAALPPSEMSKVVGAADEALQLAECRRDILLFLESRMSFLAPNLSAFLGSSLAARLVTHAGGLTALARMPAGNIMLVGATKRSSQSLSTSSSGINRGVIWQSDLVQSTPLPFRARAVRLVTGKCSLVSRVDSFKETPSGLIGIEMREKVLRSLLKAQEPPPAPLKKSLPIPDEKPKSRRGGKRHRRMKEKYGLSDLRKQANRLKFGLDPEEEVSLEVGSGLGMLSVSTGLGKLRLQTKQKKVQVPKKRQAAIAASAARSSGAGDAATSGTASSLSFTPLQGIELIDPSQKVKTGTSTGRDYFSSAGNFVKVEREMGKESSMKF